MGNVELEAKPRVSAFRRIAIGTWRDAYDPQVYGALQIRADALVDYIDDFRRATGKRLTVTHLVGKAVAVALAEVRDANSMLRFNKPYWRKRVGVFFSVAMQDPESKETDLSGLRVFDVDKMSLSDLVRAFELQVAKVRTNKDPALERTRSSFSRVPYPLLNVMLDAIKHLTYTLNLDLSRFGLPRDPFGSVIVTNIGSLGLDEAYAPLMPYSKVPLLLAVGAVKQAAVVEDGNLAVGKILRIQATFDHRLLDGKHASKLAAVLTDWLEHPYERFDRLPDAPPRATRTALP